MGGYTGAEESTSWSGQSPEPEAVYVVRPPALPSVAVPIYDHESQAVIGFRWERTTGVYFIYDLHGEFVSIYEEPLQTPLFDPIDLVFVVGGAFRALARGAAGAATRKAAVVSGMRGLVTVVSEGALVALRASMRRLFSFELKFTVATSARMAAKGRHVPVHILKLAIRYGKRAPDPQGAAGAFEYSIPMIRNGVRYTLKVVLREADNTVLHFHYFN